jgi:hypothetical protein
MTPNQKHLAAIKRAIVKRSPVSPAEWCESNLRFNEASNRRPFMTNGAEYVREVLNDFGDGTITDEVLVWGSQTRKTGTLMGGAAWCVVNDPCGFLWVMPSLTLAQKFARQRWLRMLKASPVTEPFIPTGANRHDFATLVQLLGASSFNFVGSNSAANLSSNPCRRVICDEVDKFQAGGGGEASALNLAEQRTKGQVNPQRWKTSTPTLDTGLIWQEYIKGDQRRYFVPCPHCGKEVILAWSKEMTALPKVGCEAFVAWSGKLETGEWDLDAVAASAHAVCPHCAGRITDQHKPAMVKAGVWRATNPKAATGFRSRHLPSLYSTMPECGFGALAVKFLQAQSGTLGLQGFINGDLAEPFVDQDQQRKRTERVMELSEINSKDGALAMTVDYQQSSPHFWYVIRRWFDDSCVGVAAGSCEEWDDLRAIQLRHGVKNELVMIDSGYQSADVLRHCAEHCELRGKEFFGWTASKGFSFANMWRDRETGMVTPLKLDYADPFAGTSDAYKGTISILNFLNDYFKDYLQRLREQKDGAFRWSVSREMASDEYWRHMDGEIKRFERSRTTGRTKYTWVSRGRNWPNHLFDCEVMQLAVAAFLNALPMETKSTTETK